MSARSKGFATADVSLRLRLQSCGIVQNNSDPQKAMLVIFAGLPGTGKSSIARELARQLDAVYLRIDSIEQAILSSPAGAGTLDDTGYRVANAVAEDNLRLGRIVIADSVNPIRISRDAWLEVARRANATPVEIEVT